MNSFVWNGFNMILLFKDERNEEKIAYRQLPNFFSVYFFRFWIHFRPFYAYVFFSVIADQILMTGTSFISFE